MHATLTHVRWTEDLAVSGTLDWHRVSGAGAAVLSLETRAGLNGRVRASWPAGGPEARARLSGEIAGRPLAAEMPAP